MTQVEKKQIEVITVQQLFGAGLEDDAMSWEEADEIIKSFAGAGSFEMLLDFGDHKIKYTYDSMDSGMPLRSAVRRWLEWLANKTRPPWMDEEEWEYFKRGNDDFAETYREWLEVLDI